MNARATPGGSGQKVVRGISEGSVVAALTDLCADGIIYKLPWFSSRRTSVYILVGAVVGGLVRWCAARLLWGTLRGR